MTDAATMTRPKAGEAIGRELESLLDLFNRLSGVLKAEIEALQSQRPGELKNLAEQKEVLNQEYQARMTRMAPMQSKIETVEPALMARIRNAGAQLKELISENARMINASRLAHESLIKGIADAVTARKRPVLAYGRTGALAQPFTTRDAGAVPLTFNEEI